MCFSQVSKTFYFEWRLVGETFKIDSCFCFSSCRLILGFQIVNPKLGVEERQGSSQRISHIRSSSLSQSKHSPFLKIWVIWGEKRCISEADGRAGWWEWCAEGGLGVIWEETGALRNKPKRKMLFICWLAFHAVETIMEELKKNWEKRNTIRR